MCKLKKPHVLRVSKTALRDAFGEIGGLQFTLRSRGAFVSPVNTDSRSLELSQAIVQRLELSPGCHVCVTRRAESGECVLKRLDIQSGETDVPGSVVIDSFSHVPLSLERALVRLWVLRPRRSHQCLDRTARLRWPVRTRQLAVVDARFHRGLAR